MDAVQLVVGALLIATGLVAATQRERLVARHRRQGARFQPTTAWLVVGVILTLCGAVQVANAFV